MSFRKLGLSVLLLSVCVLANDLMAQPGGGGGGGRGGRGGGGGGGFGGGMATLLANKSVQEKLELTEGQVEELEELQKDMREKMQEAFQDRDFQAIRGIMEEVNEEVKDVLLEKQVAMLEKMQNQQRYMRGGQLRIDERFLVEVLEMDEDDAEKAMESYNKRMEKFRETVKEAAEKLMKDFKKDLPASAAKKFEEMFGEELMQIEQERGGFGGFGGRGGQGGGRGGQGGGRGGQGGGRGGQGGGRGGDDF